MVIPTLLIHYSYMLFLHTFCTISYILESKRDHVKRDKKDGI